MTRRIANTQEDWFLLAAGDPQRLVTPREPIDWIVGVLQKIGTCLVNKVVCECVFSQSRHPTSYDFVTFYSYAGEQRKKGCAAHPCVAF